MTKINYILAALFILSTASASSSVTENALPKENKLKWNKERMDAISALCECYSTSQDEKKLKECLTAIPGKDEKICENISAHFKELRNKKKFKNSSLPIAKNRIGKLKTIFDECSKSSDENEIIIDMECLNQKITFTGLAAGTSAADLNKQLDVIYKLYFPEVNAPNIITDAETNNHDNTELTEDRSVDSNQTATSDNLDQTVITEDQVKTATPEPGSKTDENKQSNDPSKIGTRLPDNIDDSGIIHDNSTLPLTEENVAIVNEPATVTVITDEPVLTSSQPPVAESKSFFSQLQKRENIDSDLVIEFNPAEEKDNSLFADSKDNVKNLTKTGAGTPDTYKETGIAKDQTLPKIDIGIVEDRTSNNVGETDESGAPKNPTKTGTEYLKTGTDAKSESETKESETANDLTKAQTANYPTKTVTKTGLDETDTISTEDPEVENIPIVENETESDSDNDNESIIKVICLNLIKDPEDEYLPTDSESGNKSLQGTDNNPELNQPSSGSKQPENLTNNGTQNFPKKTVTPKSEPVDDNNKTLNDPIKTGADDLETETPEGSNSNESGSSPNVETSIFLGVPAIISYCVIILLSIAGVFYYMNSKRPEEL